MPVYLVNALSAANRVDKQRTMALFCFKPCIQKTTAQTQKLSIAISLMIFVLERMKTGDRTAIMVAKNGWAQNSFESEYMPIPQKMAGI